MDLELKELEQFNGTEQYHEMYGANLTDGAFYVEQNGYHWFISDMLIIANTLKEKQPFMSIKLKLLDDGKGVGTIDDGNGNILHEQKYNYTDAERELVLYFTDNVLMLSREY